MSTAVPTALIRQASAMIEERLGIAVHTQFRGALDEILLAHAQGDLAAFIAELEQNRETTPIWQSLIDALTIGETYFLRDEIHFELLRKQILPEIIEKHRQSGKLTINIWSVGCATGEEPYSLAITLHELLPDLGQWTVELLGTDLNGKALHAARRGVYRKWAFRHTDLDFQGRYFDPTPDGLQIKPFVRQMVTFQHSNIFAPKALPYFDLILCRNVLLYFSENHAQRAESILYGALTPGGWLLLGQAETLSNNNHPSLLIANRFPGLPIYQKPKIPSAVLPPQNGGSRREKMTTSELKALILTTYQSAVLALHQEAYAEAETLLNDLLSVDPEHASGHVLLASINANRQQVMEAHRRLDTALEINPLLADGYYLRALLYMEENETESTLKALNAALYCQRYHPLALFLLGNVYAKTGKITRATRYWENARRTIANIPPDDPICDVSQTTAGQLTAMATKQLDGWKG